MKIAPAVTAATASLLLVAAPALGAPDIDSGTYKGKVKRGGPVKFKVTSEKKLTRFQFSKVTLKCSDGDRLKLPRLKTGGDELTITDAGRFDFTARYAGGAKWRAFGKIDGNRAKGKIRISVRFHRRDQGTPNGKIVCAGTRSFRAKH